MSICRGERISPLGFLFVACALVSASWGHVLPDHVLAQESSAAVVFQITDDRHAVQPGESVVFRVTARNSQSSDAGGVRITAHIPDYLVPLSTSPAVIANPDARTLTWENITLPARAEQTFSFRAQIAQETPPNTMLRTAAEIIGPGVRSNSTDTTLVESVPFIVTEQAATTTAPSVVTTPVPPAVVPTARTGPAHGLAIASLALVLAAAAGRAAYQQTGVSVHNFRPFSQF